MGYLYSDESTYTKRLLGPHTVQRSHKKNYQGLCVFTVPSTYERANYKRQEM